jgi:N-acetylglucosaminyl-diphospho-decaprenol L-rhamnosyltransferase
LTDFLSLDDLGVAILAYGRGDTHAPLIDDLQRAGLTPSQLIVVHNPDRPSDAWTPARPDGATLIALPRNLGYAAAMNRAIGMFAERGHPAVLLLTHDARVENGTLRTLVATANAAPRYGVLGLAVRGAGGGRSVSYGSYLDAHGIVRHHSERPASGPVADSMFVDGSAMFLRLSACGPSPMPERYFMYFEEAEVCSSVRERGWGVGTAVDAVAHSSSGISRRPAAFQYLYARNGLDWAFRHRGARAAFVYGWHEIRKSLVELPKPGDPRFRDPELQRSSYGQLLSRLLGLFDFLRRRWGPPPKSLLRMSDIRNV